LRDAAERLVNSLTMAATWVRVSSRLMGYLLGWGETVR
jgi:hypothetical protein